MRIVKLYNVGDRVILTDEWVKKKYEEYLRFSEFFGRHPTEEQKDCRLQGLKDIKEKAIGIVAQNTLTQQFVRYAVEWERFKFEFEETPPYAWFEEEEIKLFEE